MEASPRLRPSPGPAPGTSLGSSLPPLPGHSPDCPRLRPLPVSSPPISPSALSVPLAALSRGLLHWLLLAFSSWFLPRGSSSCLFSPLRPASSSYSSSQAPPLAGPPSLPGLIRSEPRVLLSLAAAALRPLGQKPSPGTSSPSYAGRLLLSPALRKARPSPQIQPEIPSFPGLSCPQRPRLGRAGKCDPWGWLQGSIQNQTVLLRAGASSLLEFPLRTL